MYSVVPLRCSKMFDVELCDGCKPRRSRCSVMTMFKVLLSIAACRSSPVETLKGAVDCPEATHGPTRRARARATALDDTTMALEHSASRKRHNFTAIPQENCERKTQLLAGQSATEVDVQRSVRFDKQTYYTSGWTLCARADASDGLRRSHKLRSVGAQRHRAHAPLLGRHRCVVDSRSVPDGPQMPLRRHDSSCRANDTVLRPRNAVAAPSEFQLHAGEINTIISNKILTLCSRTRSSQVFRRAGGLPSSHLVFDRQPADTGNTTNTQHKAHNASVYSFQ